VTGVERQAGDWRRLAFSIASAVCVVVFAVVAWHMNVLLASLIMVPFVVFALARYVRTRRLGAAPPTQAPTADQKQPIEPPGTL